MLGLAGQHLMNALSLILDQLTKDTCGVQHAHDLLSCSDFPSNGNLPPSLAESRPF